MASSEEPDASMSSQSNSVSESDSTSTSNSSTPPANIPNPPSRATPPPLQPPQQQHLDLFRPHLQEVLGYTQGKTGGKQGVKSRAVNYVAPIVWTVRPAAVSAEGVMWYKLARFPVSSKLNSSPPSSNYATQTSTRQGNSPSLPIGEKGSCALCIILFLTSPALGDTQSIWNGTAFPNLAGCAQGCIYTQSINTPRVPNCDVLGLKMGCSVAYCSMAQNSCYCQPSRQANATNYISSCVNSACLGDQANIDVAINIYANYCLTHGGTLTAPASIVASTTSSLQASSTSTQTSPETTSAPPATTAPVPTSKSQEDSLPIIVGSAVGGALFLALCVLGGYILWRKKHPKPLPAEKMHFLPDRPSSAGLDRPESPPARVGERDVQDWKKKVAGFAEETGILGDREQQAGGRVSLSEVTAVNSQSRGEGEEESVVPGLPYFPKRMASTAASESVLSGGSNPLHPGAGQID
ncbi:hypothetical protein G7Y89_g3700 [Cudoniella acicularis]|uniref:CFEM domain-containing protein n=1 Tax=Cudoniella acicularis TaxID=354080 RepID=A0A8H4RSZ5_9HELO|nr:hypothetical protein G7Y89_g3700 [Cudoniella acicularis]